MKKYLSKAFLLTCFWTVAVGVSAQEQHSYRLDNPATEIATVDGSSFYCGHSGVFNAHNGKLCGTKGISQFVLDPNGSTFAISTTPSKKSAIEVYSLWEKDRMFAKTRMRVQALCYDATGSSLLALDTSGNIHFLNPINLKEKDIIATNSDILSMTCGQGSILAATQKTAVSIYNIKSKKLVKTLDLGCTPVSMAFSADGRHLAIACSDSKLRLFDTDGYKTITEVTLPVQPKMCVFSPDGLKLVVATGTDCVLVLPASASATTTTVSLGMNGIEFVEFATFGTPEKNYLVYANYNEIIYKDITSIDALR